MRIISNVSFHSAAWLLAASVTAQVRDASHVDLEAAVVDGYAAAAFELYRECEAKARDFETAIEAMLDDPCEHTLDTARSAWIDARKVYGQTEALRFYDGPIDAIEGYLNAWPIDEAYLDYVDGAPTSGLVNDAKRFPRIAETVLMFANERGGEANVTIGWHAIEFLLWGQDLDDAGPGRRPVSDYVVGESDNAERRRDYLRVTASLLRRQLGDLAAAWAQDADNYRREFVASPRESLRKLLVGITILTSFELAGERLGVAYETRDQEQEHSCFSDTTWLDFEANQLGIQRIVCGAGESKSGLAALVASRSPALAERLVESVATTLKCLRAIPQPFDATMRGADDTPGRQAMRAAIEALEAQAEILTIVGSQLGFELPLQPAGVR